MKGKRKTNQTDRPERRYLPIQEIRAEEGEDGQMIIEGYPIVYGTYADLWGFKEIIRAGAAGPALERSDEIVLWDHSSEKPMARKSNGTLTVAEDEKGVKIRADVSKTVWGRDGHEAIRNGVVDKMSFAFAIKRDNWFFEEIDGIEFEIREILEFREIYDYSPVTYPAYKDTELDARNKSLAMRSKPETETSEKAGAAVLEVLRDASENISHMRTGDVDEN